jgi:hypothetical protein
MDTTSDYVHNGTQAGEHYGWSVSLALNIEGGSINAVVVGAPHYNDGSNTDAGEVEILNAFVIPEFSSVVIPVVSIIMLVAIQRRRIILTSRKKHAKYIQNNRYKDGE